MTTTVGVLALQGGFQEHLALLRKAATRLPSAPKLDFIEVRTAEHLARCDALVIPGGESTTISLVATQSGLMEPLKDFVKIQRKPTWGTCAGLILLADEANAIKKGGQELIGGLGVRVHRNHFGRQIESFVADLELPFLGENEAKFSGVFIRAPIVEEVLSPGKVETIATLDRQRKDGAVNGESAESKPGDIIAVRQENIFGTSFHPELTNDDRIHAWWLREVLKQLEARR